MARAKVRSTSRPRTEGEPLRPALASIAVEGFKAIRRRTEIGIRPLTILAGANSSGKSSILQPLLLMKQTLEAPYDPGALLLDGAHARFTRTEQLFSRFGKKAASVLTCSLRFAYGSAISVRFDKRPEGGLDVLETSTSHPNKPDTVVRRDTAPTQGQALSSMRDRCFLWPAHGRGETPTYEILAPVWAFAVIAARSTLQSLIHVPALRGNPERTYKTTAVGTVFPGPFDPYVASIIHHWQTARDIRLKQLGAALQKLGLNWKVEATRLDDTRVELRVGRLRKKTTGGARDLVSIADVGFGVSQCLPVLVALLAARPGQLVYIEEPEIHLHPRAQVALAELLADAANRGVRVVIETHSSLLLTGVQALVAEGALPPDKVALHWFLLDKDGATEVHHASLDEAGAFGDWPEDFAEVALDVQARYLDAAEKRLRKAKR